MLPKTDQTPSSSIYPFFNAHQSPPNMKSNTLASLIAILAASAHAAPAVLGTETKLFTPQVKFSDGNDCSNLGQGALLSQGQCMAVPGAVLAFGQTRKNGMQASFLFENPDVNCDLLFYKNGFCFGTNVHSQPTTKQTECFDVSTYGSVQVNCTSLLAAASKGPKLPSGNTGTPGLGGNTGTPGLGGNTGTPGLGGNTGVPA